MIARLGFALTAILLFTAPARVEDRIATRSEDAKKDLQHLQGTWQLESIEDSKKAKLDVKKRTLFVGGDIVLVQEGERLIQAGTLRLVTSKSPRMIDVTVRKGEHVDNTMLGIYELKGDTLKVCFDPEGDSRPRQFSAKADSSIFVATYKRVKRSNEGTDICGSYRCDTYGSDGKKQTLAANIQKRGDAYFVRWEVRGGLAYVGTGIRKGDTLSVAWLNRGSAGISVYTIEKGPKLVGQYTEVGGPGLVGREVLSFSKTNWVEVRNRR
jgi:uncharacterized protein (TIGR03067 family)